MQISGVVVVAIVVDKVEGSRGVRRRRSDVVLVKRGGGGIEGDCRSSLLDGSLESGVLSDCGLLIGF